MGEWWFKDEAEKDQLMNLWTTSMTTANGGDDDDDAIDVWRWLYCWKMYCLIIYCCCMQKTRNAILSQKDEVATSKTKAECDD
jgi:hypothetical protein